MCSSVASLVKLEIQIKHVHHLRWLKHLSECKLVSLNSNNNGLILFLIITLLISLFKNNAIY